MKLNGLALTAVSALAAVTMGCAHDIKKADIPSGADSSAEISRLESEINAGYGEQLDVLAIDPFTQSQKYLEEAKSDLKSGETQEEVREDLGYAQAYLQRAREIADGRRQGAIEPVLEARSAALAGGAKNTPQTRVTIKELDDELRDNAKNFRTNFSQEDITRLQGSYLGVELAGIQARELGSARAIVADARKNGALKNTPKTLAHADMSLATAENVIAANRHNSPGYVEAVDKANASAQLLTEVLSTSKRPGPDIEESAALALVAQSRKIASLEGKLGTAEASVNEMSDSLRTQNQKLKGATAAIGLQQALKQAQAQFSKDEAEVYQEGDKLLIRLKAMKFPTGKADLPPASLALLAKVKDVAANLGPAAVRVEGHTDSVGGATKNVALSQTRAETVAKYFQENGLESDRVDAIGLGFKKPIASNKSKAGRAQNRRVDVLITPEAASATAEEAPQGTSN